MRRGWLPKPVYARLRRMEREVKRLRTTEMMRQARARMTFEIRERFEPTPEERRETELRRITRGRRSYPSIATGYHQDPMAKYRDTDDSE